MGVEYDNGASCWPTENLILKSGRKRFRTGIAPLHWQLRSLLSAEGNDVVYYPAGARNTHITRLNTQSRETETIQILGFEPRCLVASNGLICCGGEEGEFALIRNVNHVDGAADDALGNDFRAQLSDLESPPGNNASSTQFSRDMFTMLEQRLRGPARKWTISSGKFGDERVNCITIWLPPSATDPHPAKPGSHPFPVALLANNDKTLVTVGLDDCEQLDKIEYPDCVNRGVISPDGTILAAITDDPYLYVHARALSKRLKLSGDSYEWKALPRIRLKSKDKESPQDCKGSFALCFSPSGRYLAVGTQYGTVSIFEVAALADPDRDPMVTWFNSARFPHDDGAIRDMAFCPGPYDLLAWSEHRGRIGIADGRTNFAQRQVIAIGDQLGFEPINLNERNPTIDPQLLDRRTERSTPSGSASQLSNLLQAGPPRPLHLPTIDTAERYNHPFDAEETAVLEAFQSDRRRREARDLARDLGGYPRTGGPLRTPMWAERVSASRSSLSSLRSTLERQVDLMEPETYREIAHILQQQRETLTRILEREQRRGERDHHRPSGGPSSAADPERERRAPTPRRRSSIMQALSQNAQTPTLDALATLTRGALSGSNEASRSQDPSAPEGTQRLTSGWADLDALYNITSGGEGGGSGSAGSENWARPEASRSRRALPIISDTWIDDLAGFGARRHYGRGNRDHQQNADDTGGLAWSEDGQSLYVGAEDGIYEVRVNLQGRKVFPHVMLR